MKKNLSQTLGRRMLSLVMVLFMAFPWVSTPAMAASDWSDLQISVSWQDGSGNTQSRTAAPMKWNQAGNTFWVQVDSNTPLDGLTLSIYHPNHPDYTFAPGNGDVLTNVQNAQGLESNAVYITAFSGNATADSYILYVSTNVVPPEPVPTQKPPAQKEIDVIYKGTDDADLGGTKFTAVEGQENPVQAPPTLEKNGKTYTLKGDAVQYVTVNGSGEASPSPVIFSYDPPRQPAQKEIDVIYKGTDDADLGGTKFTAVEGQENPVQAPSTLEKNGKTYTLKGDAVQYVTVNGNGEASPSPVIFSYDPPKEAAKFKVQIDYVKDGQVFYTDYQDITAGKTEPVPEDVNQTPAGYKLDGPNSVDVFMDANGVATPNKVTFTYVLIQVTPVSGKVTVEYIKDNAAFFTEDVYVNAPNGPVPARSEKTPEGYKLEGESSVNVTVDAQGKATPDKVTFKYVPIQVAPVTAKVTVEYAKDNAVFFTEDVYVNAPSGPVPARSEKTPEGYKLEGESSVSVTVDANGTASPNKVTFKYVPIQVTPVTAKVTVEYIKDNAAFHSEEVTVKAPGEPVYADTNQTPAGYKLDGPDTVNVSVDANGVATPNKVTFKYVPKQVTPVTAQVTVNYSKDGSVFFTEQVPVTAPSGPVTARDDKTPTEYKLQGAASVTVAVNDQGVASPNTVTFNYVPDVTETIPVGNPIDRWGVTNNKVNFRSSPTTNGDNRIKELPQGTHVWMFESQYGENNDVWTRVRVDGQDGYIMVKYLEMMTQAQSDGYQATLPSPMPTRSPAPTTPPTTVPQYAGYALTTKKVALRVAVGSSDQDILSTLPKDTLVKVVNQVYQGTVPWSLVETLDGLTGYVQDDSLRRINQEEAKYYIDQYNAAHPTAVPQTPTPSPAPVQQHGYAATLGDNVPVRGAADPNSMLVNMLAKNTVVYVSGQEYLNGIAWHIVQYKGQWGYIRADQLRWLSQQETTDYLNSLQTPTPTPANTLPPLDQNSASSYGYVTKDGVNFRSAPGGSKIGTLNKYAFALVLGSTQADGKTWYKVNQAGKQGYISGDFFHVLSLAELEEFLQSPEYTQGATGNTGNNNNNNTGNNNGNPPTAPEDWNVGTWTNPNTGLNATYEPFDPYTTPEPIPTPTASPTPEPLATFEPLPTDPPVETQSDSPSFVWLGLGVALLGGFGGLYAYALHKSNQRKAAARAAQRKASMQQNPQNGARPYARATNAPMVPPASGTQVRPATPPTGAPKPQTPGSTSSPSPYSQRPAGAQPSGMAQRPPVARPGQPGTAPAARPGQQPGAFARPMTGTQQGGQSTASYRPEAQGNATASDTGTSRQPRAARHTGNPTDQNKPTDTNENL